MKTVKIINLTKSAPSTGMSSGRVTGGSTSGTRLVIMKKKKKFFFCLDGSDKKGNWWESDNQSPYKTKGEAIAEGRAHYEELQTDIDDYQDKET